MPCRGPDSEYELLPGELKAMGANSRQPEIDKLTRIACKLCKYIDSTCDIPVECLNNVYGIDLEVIDWWKEHQKQDEKRKEKLQKNALAKLTMEEREALGLK